MAIKRVLNNGLADSVEQIRLLGEIAVENVLDWFNGSIPDERVSQASMRRTRELLDNLKIIVTAERSGHLRVQRPLRGHLLRAIDAVNSCLADYPSLPLVGWHSKRPGLSFGEEFVSRKRTEGEAATASSLMRLAELDLIDSVRECICGNWFQARSKVQKSCSPKCRHKLYEQSPESKARRRSYMRRYYRLKRSGKVK